MIAHLGMYDRPETAAANDRLWQAIRASLGFGPTKLTRDVDFWQVWHSPDLLFSQTCGMPYRTRLHDKVTLIGTPDYGLPDCPPGHYRSIFVAHKDNAGKTLSDFSGHRFAYNEPVSQSGWAAPQCHALSHNVHFDTYLETGGHAHSAQAVADKRADIASLDALTWALIQKYDTFAQDLIVIDQTPPTPTLPFITAKNRDPAPLFAAIKFAIHAINPADRALLHLHDIVEIPAAAYLAIPTPPPPP
jgi:ABC-type phosphate/phosphonate transport system substrate-binding protein